ncbi:MAG: CinA family protein [Puniceicoccales bacterium]|jgi:nicotinamide-nucleotide amidase|nr:CinA family protein [Puniceicoccales bacterium]
MTTGGVHAVDGSLDESHYAFQGRDCGTDIYSLISLCHSILRRRKQTVAIAEAVTGGMLSNLWSNEPDIATVFSGSVVVWGEKAMASLLDIPEIFLQNFNWASREVAGAMAQGLRRRLFSDFSIAVVGIGSRAGSSPSQPVGLVWVAIHTPTREIVQRLDFSSYATQRNLIYERACYAVCKIFLQVIFEEDFAEEGSPALDPMPIRGII